MGSKTSRVVGMGQVLDVAYRSLRMVTLRQYSRFSRRISAIIGSGTVGRKESPRRLGHIHTTQETAGEALGL
jgi:hypothetical protein